MKAIAKLKDDARRHEQKEEWEKAINAYIQVLRLADQGDSIELDLPLYNRVGDLFVRLGRERDAVTYYEQAADRYAEAGLYNNAIALCNKALRYDEGRLELLKKLGAFSASQGFFTDARRWYLAYAEKAIGRGQIDEAFVALSELAQVSEDVEVRELVARQLRDHGRIAQAVEEYTRAYAMRVAAGQQREADAIKSEMQLLDPGADLNAAAVAPVSTPHLPRRSEHELPGFMDLHVPDRIEEPEPTPPAREPEPVTLPQAPSQEAAAVDELPELAHGEADRLAPEAEGDFEVYAADTLTGSTQLEAPVEPLAFEIERPVEIGPMEVEEEHELFDLNTFASLAGSADDQGGELPLLGDQPYDSFESIEPLPEIEGLEKSDILRGSEEGGLTPLDIGEIEQDDAGLLPEEDSLAADRVDDFQSDHELEFWAQPSYGQPIVQSPTGEPVEERAGTVDSEAVADYEPAVEWEVQSPPAGGTVEEEEPAAPDVAPVAELELPTWSEEVATAPRETWSEHDDEPPTIDLTRIRLSGDTALEEAGRAELSPTEAEPPTAALPEPRFEFDEELAEQLTGDALLELDGGEVYSSRASEEAEAAAVESPLTDSAAAGEITFEASAEPYDEAEFATRDAGGADYAEPPLAPDLEPPVAYAEPAPPPYTEVEPALPEAPLPAPASPASRSGTDYIDLAALLGDDENATESTRFVVAESPATGDEDKDFADMLRQFKQKVAQVIPREDAGSHYDLGLAFKEMGLVEEAISQFQTALRSGQEKLKVYEELGSCFVIKQQYGVAVTVLTRAQQMPYADESELLGVYYNLGRAYEELGQRPEAKAAYEKIIGIDIGFRDTSARLARL